MSNAFVPATTTEEINHYITGNLIATYLLVKGDGSVGITKEDFEKAKSDFIAKYPDAVGFRFVTSWRTTDTGTDVMAGYVEPVYSGEEFREGVVYVNDIDTVETT